MKKKPTFNIIGAGKLGLTLAADILKFQLGTIQGICNRTLCSAQKAVEHLGTAKAYATPAQLPHADMILITCPDSQITACAELLKENPSLTTSDTVMHFSGVLSAEALMPLQGRTSRLVSLHPMRSFISPASSTFNNAFCALEGDANSLDYVKTVFAPLHLKWLPIHTAKKALYHAAGVFSANYVISVLHAAQRCLLEAGLDEFTSFNLITDLAASVITNIKRTQSLPTALTGPLQRNDKHTISAHLDALPADLNSLYRRLGLNLVELTALSANEKTALIELLRQS